MIEVTETTFSQVLEADKAVVKFYFKSGCKPCDLLKPIFDGAEALNPDIKFFQMGFEMGKKPEGELLAFLTKYSLRSFPTVVIFEKGIETGRAGGKDALNSLKLNIPVTEYINEQPQFISPEQLVSQMSTLQINMFIHDLEKVVLQRKESGYCCAHCKTQCVKVCEDLGGKECEELCSAK